MPGWGDDIGSWKNPDMPKYFEDFVQEGMQHIGNTPMLHTIINEPTVDAMFTRRSRRWLAHKLGDVEYMEMLERLAEAHIRARKIILSVAPESEISIAHAATWNDTNIPALKKYWDDEGYFFIDLLRDMGGPNVINRLGLNLYFRRTGNRGQDVRAGWDGQVSYSPNQVFSDACDLTNGLKWEMYPEVLYHAPLAYWQSTAIPSTSRSMAIRSKVSRITENAGQLPRELNNSTEPCRREWTSAVFIGGPDLITSNGVRDGAISASFMSIVKRRSGGPRNPWNSCEIASPRVG
jgi:hypothetical protein